MAMPRSATALTGHWYLHGDFNPAVALPVWPLLLAAVFHFTGVSLSADRSLALVFFGLGLLLAYCVVRTQAERWVALLAVTLLATSPFLWAFSRLAILEAPLLCFLLLSWLLALRLPRTSPRLQTLVLVGIGLLLFATILTKTTAIFLIPSTLFLVARAWTGRRRTRSRPGHLRCCRRAAVVRVLLPGRTPALRSRLPLPVRGESLAAAVKLHGLAGRILVGAAWRSLDLSRTLHSRRGRDAAGAAPGNGTGTRGHRSRTAAGSCRALR